ncbi:LOS1, partial [Acrasis kona]
MIKQLDISSINDKVTLEVCKQILDDRINHAQCTTFIRKFLCQKITSLQQSAPRLLLSSVQLAATRNPKATIDGLLVPLISISNKDGSPTLKSSQLEVINRVVDVLPIDFTHLFFHHICEEQNVIWNEDLVVLVKSLIVILLTPNKKDKTIPVQNISNVDLNLLLLKLSEVCRQFTSSSKFATLIHTIITKVPASQIVPNVTLIQDILKTNTTFM